MPINKFLYFGDFFAIPVAVTVLAYFALTAGGLWTGPDFGVSLLTGLVTWTLAEYAIHRFVYHHAPLFSALHDSHHQAPNEFIGVPSFVSSGFIVVACYFPLRVLGDVAASGGQRLFVADAWLAASIPAATAICGWPLNHASAVAGSRSGNDAIVFRRSRSQSSIPHSDGCDAKPNRRSRRSRGPRSSGCPSAHRAPNRVSLLTGMLRRSAKLAAGRPPRASAKQWTI